MTQLIRNYIALGGTIDLAMANDIYVLFVEYAQGVSKVKCYDRLYNLLGSEFPEREYEPF